MSGIAPLICLDLHAFCNSSVMRVLQAHSRGHICIYDIYIIHTFSTVNNMGDIKEEYLNKMCINILSRYA